jgi:ATP-binding cassette subfamily F protein uup
MDEPTNDLDSETLELLEDKLVDFPGTLIVVSHDREFLNNCVTSMLVFEPGGVKEYVGGYNDYIAQRKLGLVATQNECKSTSRAAREVAAAAVANKTSAKKLSFKEKIELDSLPERIESLETELTAIHNRMSDPDYFRRPPAEQSADQKRACEIEEQVEVCLHRWEELSERS